MSKNRPVRDLTEQEVQIIREILENGNTAEIKPIKDGELIILETQKKLASKSQ